VADADFVSRRTPIDSCLAKSLPGGPVIVSLTVTREISLGIKHNVAPSAQHPSTLIVISGDLGSGKSTVAKLLGMRLNLPVVSIGELQRQIAARRGLTTLELNKLAETDSSIDRDIDSLSAEIERTRKSAIVDSRMAWHFIPSAFKVFLTVDEVTAAERIWNIERNAERQYESIEAALRANRARRQSETTRFQLRYAVDITSWKGFDLIVNTTTVDKADVVELIVRIISEAAAPTTLPRYYTSPQACFPTESGALRRLGNIGSELNSSLRPSADLVCINGVNLIWGPHLYIAQAIMADETFVCANVLATCDDDVLPNGLRVRRYLEYLPSQAHLYDWEDALRFRFYRYPDWFLD
jgi:cytidylate kinase